MFQWSYQAEDGSDKPLVVAAWYPPAQGQADQGAPATDAYLCEHLAAAEPEPDGHDEE